MGGAVSSGRDNNELIDNLVSGNYIRTREVERVFRALDRADYMTREARDQAYKDLAWRHGPLHLSAPCIYSEVMEGLELSPGLSFLNVGSGTGYLSTLVGLILGSGGISHGVEVHAPVVDYATRRLGQFIENSPVLDEFDFCEPKYYCGNGLCIAPLQAPYDRVYCGAGCPEEYQNYFKQLIKVGGILVMPLNDNLVQVRRLGDAEWSSRNLLNVTFAPLRVPDKREAGELIRLEEQAPARLQALCRGAVRAALRGGVWRRHPDLRAPPPSPPPAKRPRPRRIIIPIEDDSDVEGLNSLHDLDRGGGAGEMNALLSLVLSMGPGRVAGALRFDAPEDDHTSEGERAEGTDERTESDSQSPRRSEREGGGRSESGDSSEREGNPRGERPERRDRRGRDWSDRDSSDSGDRGQRDNQNYKERSERELSGERWNWNDRERESEERGERSARERSEKRDRGERSDRQRRDRGEREERGDRTDRERSERRHREERGDRSDRERSDRERSDRGEREELGDRSERGEREERGDRSERGEREERGDRSERGEREERGDRSERGEREERGDGSDRERSERGERGELGERGRARLACRGMLTFELRGAERRGSDAPAEPSGGAARPFVRLRRAPAPRRDAPDEVEIYLGKMAGGEATTSREMDWDADEEEDEADEEGGEEEEEEEADSAAESEPADVADAGADDDDDAAAAGKDKPPRHKLDSGVGESAPSASSASSPGSASPRRAPHDADRAGRRRRQKRAAARRPDSGSGSPAGSRRPKRRAADGADARRVRLSVLMKRAVKELPLPYALQKYVNLGRCFEF